MARIAVLLTVLTLAANGLSYVEAGHDGYKYKWPWYAGTTAVVTSLPYSGVHQCDNPETPEVEQGSCTDAWDFDIPDYDVLTGAEGEVVGMFALIPSTECDPADGLGNWIKVRDQDGLEPTYAHLASVNTFLVAVLQGDQLGVMGHTGFTQGSDPGTINGIPYAFCGDHLHWEFGRNSPTNPVHPSTINGETSNSFGTKTSTNELIGGFLAPEAVATRSEYVDEGAWQTVGWLVSVGGSDLELHRWGTGWEQLFQNHDGVGGFYVSDSVGDAFWVRPSFWSVFDAAGGATGPLGYPIGDHLTPCPSGAPSGCQEYQQFECGFIYNNGSTTQAVATCSLVGLGAVTTNGFYKYLAQASSTWENRSDYPPSGSQETYVQNLKSFGNGRLVYKDIVAAGSSFSVGTDGGFTWAQITPPGGSWVPVDADLCPDGKLWLAWYNRSGSPDLLRIYYLDPFGATSPQLADEVSIPSGAAAHDNGSVSCHPANASRIAVTVQNTWGAAVVVTTTGGGDGTWVVRNTGAVANAYRTVWSGSRLILVHDVSYWFRIRISDDDGQTWTETAAFSSVAGSEKGIDVIRTPVSGLVFSYIDDSTGGTDRVLRSIQNGDATTWVGAALPAGLSGSFTGPRAIGYDVENDDLYVASNSTSGTVYRLPNAGSRDWSTVTAADWVSIPTSGGRPGYRGFTVIKE